MKERFSEKKENTLSTKKVRFNQEKKHNLVQEKKKENTILTKIKKKVNKISTFINSHLKKFSKNKQGHQKDWQIRNMLQCVKDECYYEGRDEWSEKDLCYRDPTHLKKETNEQ